MLLLLFLPAWLSLAHASNPRGLRSRSTGSLANSDKLPRDSGTDPCEQAFQTGSAAIPALDAYNCLVSVPINQTVASQFLQYYKDTLEFQSTLTYLKNPPPSYQQPSVDLLGGLDQVQKQLNTEVFTNEYEFEIAVLDLVYSAHDSHTYLYGGATNVFSFGSPFQISSVSVDGVQPPKVFMADDLFSARFDGYTASPIATINGQPVIEYLTDFAAVNSKGYLESHADWNSLMFNPAANILGLINTFSGSSPFYPGDVMGVVFENGSTFSDTWMAVLNDFNNEQAVSTALEFYDTFVVYNSFATATATSKKKRAAATATADQLSVPSVTPPPWNHSEYPPDPIVSQPNLGNGGVVTGYLIDDATAVLSIPTFDVDDEDATTFSTTVAEFLAKSKALGAKKIIIDLQQNYGGRTLLATDTFKHFFPTIDPFSGSRGRAHTTANTLGSIYTEYYNAHLHEFKKSDVDYFSDNVWIASNYLDAMTDKYFASWVEYYGPHEDRLDFFTTTQRDNLSNPVFDENAFGRAIYGYLSGNKPPEGRQPYDPQDIVILTDGLCSSTCALFVEMMHHEAGVKTIAVGGLPQLLGPMQTVAGSRGARHYEADLVDLDIFSAQALNPSTASQLPDREIDFYLDTANFNLQDQVRRGDNFPLQFAYEAAQCRIYYTHDTIFNMTVLWSHAARATWTEQSLCVKYSTGHPSSTGQVTDTLGPSRVLKDSWAYPTTTAPSAASSSSTSALPSSNHTSFFLAGLEDSDSPDPETDIAGPVGEPCNPKDPHKNENGNKDCQQLACVQAPWCSRDGEFKPLQYQCVRLARDTCPAGHIVGTGKCKQGLCEFCKPEPPVTSQTCRKTKTKKLNTVKNGVPDDRTSGSPQRRRRGMGLAVRVEDRL